MTIILTTATGTTQVSHISDIAQAIEFAEQYGHECTGEYKLVAETVSFDWDFEDCGSEGIIKCITVKVDGKENDNLCESGRSIPDARKAAKKLAKTLNADFVELTAKGTANDYRSMLAVNNNENR